MGPEMGKLSRRLEVGDKVRHWIEGRSDIVSIEGKVIDVLDTGCWIQPSKRNQPMFFQHSELKLISSKPSKKKQIRCKSCVKNTKAIRDLIESMSEMIDVSRRLTYQLKSKLKEICND